MPSEEFPKPKHEMSQQDLEAMLEVKLDPTMTAEDLLHYWENDPYGYARYIVTPSWDIVISLYQHNELVKIIGVDREECLIPDGDFKYSKKDKSLEFIYLRDEKIPNIRNAAEQKIKSYMISKGLVVEKITHLVPRHRKLLGQEA